MSLFRREPLHVRLAREAGLQTDERPPHDPTPRWGEVGIHGVARPREWDAVVTAEAPQLGVGELEFVVLPDGTLVVDDALDVEPGSLDPLAAALEALGVARGESFVIRAERLADRAWEIEVAVL